MEKYILSDEELASLKTQNSVDLVLMYYYDNIIQEFKQAIVEELCLRGIDVENSSMEDIQKSLFKDYEGKELYQFYDNYKNNNKKLGFIEEAIAQKGLSIQEITPTQKDAGGCLTTLGFIGAVGGGLLGFGIAIYLLNSSITDADGTRISKYNDSTRNLAKIMLVIAIVSVVIQAIIYNNV
ncbi:MAG: hypothetical protein LBR17_07500 [Bacteroidales bacterium]|jgi:hypothetical protein|nr:hypothetical protein [Bacteroidales bacterium]